ncbi:MAG: UDP-2,3-diacylglucosamine diphosphatase [Rhizobiaceae bacterium]
MNVSVSVEAPDVTRYRAIWISDIHLGTRRAQCEYLLDFFRHTESDFLYLVGDIADNWSLKKKWYWKQSHNDVLQKILRKARKGTRVTYIPGNHDEQFRDFVGTRFGRVKVKQNAIHVGLNGKRYLVLHGDEFDGVIQYAKWLAFLGDSAYEWAMSLGILVNRVRRWFGMPYWSLSAYLKNRVKRAVEYLSLFEDVMVREARRHGADGVICGHVHTPEMRLVDGIAYFNDGDWVESCSALVEHLDGRFEILHWAEREASPARASARPLEVSLADAG